MPATRIFLRLIADFVVYLGLLVRRRKAIAAENLFLRRQLALYQERKVGPRPGFLRMYLRTVRGETLMPSLTSSSLAFLSSPHSKLSRDISRIKRRSSAGIGGRPGFDFQCHRSRNSGSMPANQRLRLDHNERIAPVE